MGSDRGRHPTPGYITAIDGDIELSPLLWLPSTRAAACLFSGVLGSGCGSHGGTFPTEFSPQLPGAHPVTQLHCTPLWDTAWLYPGAGVGPDSALLCAYRQRAPRRIAFHTGAQSAVSRASSGQEEGTYTAWPHLCVAPRAVCEGSGCGEHGFASLGSQGDWSALTAGCCAQSFRAQHFRADLNSPQEAG